MGKKTVEMASDQPLEILLIRHGETAWNKERRVMGRKPIPLSKSGRRESRRVASILRTIPLEAVYTSPVHRAVESACIIARGRRLKLKMAPEVAEINYGGWVGKTFEEIACDPEYQTYHRTPKEARPPGGERILDAARRACLLIERIRKRHRRGGRVVVVSHADVIKAILIRYLKMDLNRLLRFRIDNSSISILWFYGKMERVLGVNCHASAKKLFWLTDQLPIPFQQLRKR